MGAPSVPNTNAVKAVQKSLEVSCTIEFGLELSKHFVQFTATQSIFVMTAGPVDLTVTFLSPVEVSIHGPYYLEEGTNTLNSLPTLSNSPFRSPILPYLRLQTTEGRTLCRSTRTSVLNGSPEIIPKQRIGRQPLGILLLTRSNWLINKSSQRSPTIFSVSKLPCVNVSFANNMFRGLRILFDPPGNC